MSSSTLPLAKQKLPPIGTKVTTRVIRPACYSGYGGRPPLIFTPELTGIVAVQSRPNVRAHIHNGLRYEDACLVDFLCPASNQIERVDLYDYMIEVLPPETKTDCMILMRPDDSRWPIVTRLDGTLYDGNNSFSYLTIGYVPYVQNHHRPHSAPRIPAARQSRRQTGGKPVPPR